jgi:hypothetical protein
MDIVTPTNIILLIIWLVLIWMSKTANREISSLMERMDDVEIKINDLRIELNHLGECHDDLEETLIDKNIIPDPDDGQGDYKTHNGGE